jgi:hypothetical protein
MVRSTAIALAALLITIGGDLAGSAAFAGAPLKCVEVKCRHAADERKSGSIIISDCTIKHGRRICKDDPPGK